MFTIVKRRLHVVENNGQATAIEMARLSIGYH